MSARQEALRHIRNGPVAQDFANRRDQALAKVKDRTDLGMPYDAAFNEVKRIHPHLFESAVQEAKRISKII